MFKKKFCFHCKKSFRIKKMWEYNAHGNLVYVCPLCGPTKEIADGIFNNAMNGLAEGIVKDFKESWKEKQTVDGFKW